MPAPPPAKRPPPPPTKAPPPKQQAAATKEFTIERGITLEAHKIVLYGTGGCGKSELCSLLGQLGIEVLFLDVDNETAHLDVARVVIDTWDELRAAAQNVALVEPFGAVVVDSGTIAEEKAVEWVIANVDHEKNKPVRRLEDYGWGKGYQHVYETFLLLLQDLDALARRGKHVIVTAHDCLTLVPNPAGEDFKQHQPRLQDLASGKASIRRRLKEWATHLFFIKYDVSVEDGKAQGAGTRSIYTSEQPTHLAKSRTLPADEPPIPYDKGDAELWRRLFQKET